MNAKIIIKAEKNKLITILINIKFELNRLKLPFFSVRTGLLHDALPWSNLPEHPILKQGGRST